MFFQDPLSYRLFFSFLFKPTSLWNSSFTWKLLLSRNNVRNILFFLPFFWNDWFSEFSLSPLCLICAKIVGMDKIIKTISESGAFRAYVLDSTETVRTAQEKHHTQASSTVALGRTLIASQILAANEKGDTKITVKVLGTSSLGAIITVADTKETSKATCKILEWISRRLRLVKFWWDHLSETENSWSSLTMVREILITPWPLL